MLCVFFPSIVYIAVTTASSTSIIVGATIGAIIIIGQQNYSMTFECDYYIAPFSMEYHDLLHPQWEIFSEAVGRGKYLPPRV